MTLEQRMGLPMNRKQEEISELLRREISSIILHELSDPRMGFVTVTKVEPAPDLRSAKVYLSVLGEEAVCRRTLTGIRHAAGFIRSKVGRAVSLKSVPQLRFVRDDSAKRSVHISRLIADAVEDASPEEEPPDP